KAIRPYLLRVCWHDTGTLVRLAQGQFAEESTHVEARSDKFPRQQVEQFRMRRRVGGMVHVHWLDESSPHEQCPEAVDGVASKAGVVTAGEQRSELSTTAEARHGADAGGRGHLIFLALLQGRFLDRRQTQQARPGLL